MAQSEIPLVSIVVPAYNAEDTIIETLESIAKQSSFACTETIIVNDGSTDNTVNTVQDFIADKPSMRLYSKENEGLAATRNYGFQFVKGKYLLFLDADDLIDVDFISLSLEQFKSNPEIDIVTTEVQHFERESHIYIPPTFSAKTILKINCFVITSLIKSQAFREIGMFDTNLRFHEDWEMWIRMTEKYNRVAHIDKPLFWYRKRNSQNSLCDLNGIDDIASRAHLYIYNKHFRLFSSFGFNLRQLFDGLDKATYYQKKYNGLWYRKLYYRYFGRKSWRDYRKYD